MKRCIALFLSLICIVMVSGCNNVPDIGNQLENTSKIELASGSSGSSIEIIEETPPGFLVCRYFAELDGKIQCIAEVFGYTVSEPEVYSKDIDGDGVKELICNCTFGTGS